MHWIKQYVFFHGLRHPDQMGPQEVSRMRQLHLNDLRQGLGRAPLPNALARKYPNADTEWGWQYVFPASSHYTDRQTGVRHRHHLHETVVQKAMSEAVRRAGLTKPASPHTSGIHSRRT